MDLLTVMNNFNSLLSNISFCKRKMLLNCSRGGVAYQGLLNTGVVRYSEEILHVITDQNLKLGTLEVL